MAFTYLIGWSADDVWYYGYSSRDPSVLWDSYFTSSKHVARFRELNGEPDVIRVHRLFETKEQANAFEVKFLKKVGAVRSQRWLNRHDTQKFMGPSEYSKQSRQKMSESAKKRPRRPISDETRKKISLALKGRKRGPQSEETKRKKSLANSGKTISEEHKKAISAANSGRVRSEESKELQRQKMMGRVSITEEGRRRLSEAHTGQKRPKEWCDNISKAKRGLYTFVRTY